MVDYAAERKKLRQRDEANLRKTLYSNAAVDAFPSRPTNNIAINALKDIQDYGYGISSAVSSVPSFIRGDIKASPKDIIKAIGQGYAESYGQQNGLNVGNLAQSFVKHPLNILDVLPVAGALSKTGTVAKTVGKLGKAGKAFDAMGEISRASGKYTVKGGALPSKEADNFIKFATKSGANQYGKYAGAGELKAVKSKYLHPEDLSRITPKLYREMAPANAVNLLNKSMDMTPFQLYFANHPDLALGQGTNKGVLMEFDSKGILGNLDTSKPGSEFLGTKNQGEFVSKFTSQDTYKNNIRKITIKPDAKMSLVDKKGLQNAVKGWAKEISPDGSYIYTPPYKPHSGSLTPGQQHTFAHIFGTMKPTQDILNKVKTTLGVKSLKDIPEDKLSSLIENIRGQMPTKQTKISNQRLVQGFRTPEYTPKGIAAMRGAKKAFTGSVLTTPSWLVGNRVGDAVFALGANRNPIELYAKGLNPAYKGLVNPNDLGGFYRNASTDIAKNANPNWLEQLDDKWNSAFFNTEGKLEQATRRGAFVKNLEDIAKTSLKQQGLPARGADLAKELSRQAKVGTSYDKAVKLTRQQFGDYRNFDTLKNAPMPDWAKQYSSEILASPFIKWSREAPKILAHQVVNNPVAFGVQRALGKFGTGMEEQQRDWLDSMDYQVPEYARGGFVKGFDETGRPEIFNAGKLLPHTTLANVARAAEKFPSQESLMMANPMVTLPNQVATGTNFTGRQATSPNTVTDFNSIRYYRDPQTGEMSQLQGTELPPGEGLKYLLSTILRNFTKAGAAERWMPERTYDTRIFTPDTTKSEKPSEYVLQNLGFGNVTKAFKKPNVDTSRLERRYQQRLQP